MEIVGNRFVSRRLRRRWKFESTHEYTPETRGGVATETKIKIKTPGVFRVYRTGTPSQVYIIFSHFNSFAYDCRRPVRERLRVIARKDRPNTSTRPTRPFKIPIGFGATGLLGWNVSEIVSLGRLRGRKNDLIDNKKWPGGGKPYYRFAFDNNKCAINAILWIVVRLTVINCFSPTIR